MTKIELAREVAVSEHLHLSTAVQAIDAALRVISEALAQGDTVTIKGFGTFAPTQCKERTAYNFHKGQPCTIPAHRGAKLIPSKQLIHNLNTDNGKEAAQ